MKNILFLESANSLGVDNGFLLVRAEGKGDVSLHISDVELVLIASPYCNISVPSLILCSDHQVPVIICNHQHQPEIECLNLYRHTELLACLREQLAWTESSTRHVWVSILKHKLLNQERVLAVFNAPQEQVELVRSYKAGLRADSTVDELNTAESIAARVYFKALFGSKFKRFESDAVNAALNFGYAIIRAQLSMIIVAKGLHPSLGIWHHSVRNRFNLSDDFIEILRPWVDYHVKKLSIQDEFTKEHKVALLELLYKEVCWQSKSYHLKTALVLWVDELVKSLSCLSPPYKPINMLDFLEDAFYESN